MRSVLTCFDSWDRPDFFSSLRREGTFCFWGAASVHGVERRACKVSIDPTLSEVRSRSMASEFLSAPEECGDSPAASFWLHSDRVLLYRVKPGTDFTYELAVEEGNRVSEYLAGRSAPGCFVDARAPHRMSRAARLLWSDPTLSGVKAIAILAQEGLGLVVAAFYMAFVRTTSPSVRLFHDADKAMEWLQEELDRLGV